MPLQATSGAASYDGFGGGVAVVPQYIEDVFSTYLYTGTGASLPIVNGIDLSGKGGLVWSKRRSGAAQNKWYDSARGIQYAIESDTTDANQTEVTGITSFNSDGYTYGTDGNTNSSGSTYASWTFRKQPKFFDVVTYTGDGSGSQTINHNLGSVPGCIIVKSTSSSPGAGNWAVYHRSLGTTKVSFLNLTDASYTLGMFSSVTSTSFNVTSYADVNASGVSFVAYVFAHDAGGFGLTGTDNVISCGSFTTDGSGNATVSLGYEPQWALVKRTDAAGTWWMMDTMRGWTASTGNNFQYLQAQSSSAEGAAGTVPVNATGFTVAGNNFSASATYIYIAIRRGPMKVPTLGTSVFGLNARTGTGADATVTGGQTDDAVLIKNRGSAVASLFSSRLTGTGYLVTSDTAAEVAAGTTILQANPWDVMDGVKVGTTSTITNASASTYINYLFRRAPGFFDVVCGTSNASGNTFTSSHNLTVAPELLIIKSRGVIDNWWTIQVPAAKFGTLNGTGMGNTLTSGDYTGSASTFSFIGYVGNSTTHVAYLFATCAGVSKVGGYTGTGTTLQIDCGFTAGARFVLIKRTDASSDWYVWDSARGIVAGNDSYLLLNSTAAEVTSTDYIDTYSAGFEISSTAPAAINASAGTFVFLAIA